MTAEERLLLERLETRIDNLQDSVIDVRERLIRVEGLCENLDKSVSGFNTSCNEKRLSCNVADREKRLKAVESKVDAAEGASIALKVVWGFFIALPGLIALAWKLLTGSES